MDKRIKTTRVAIYGFVLRKNGEYLLIRRAKHDSQPGLWEIPGGGLEPGEDPIDGVKREVVEETGLNVKVQELIGLKNYYRPEVAKQTLRAAYLCTLGNDDENITLSPDHDDYKWVSARVNLEDKISIFTNAIVQMLKNKKVL